MPIVCPISLFSLFSSLDIIQFIILLISVGVGFNCNSLFGGPSNFGGAQLPTFRQVRKQFLQSKIDLGAQNPGKIVTDLDVAKNVLRDERQRITKKQVAQRQYMVSDTRCPALSDCELE